MSRSRAKVQPATRASGERVSVALTRLVEMAIRNSVEKLSAMLRVPILIDGVSVENSEGAPAPRPEPSAGVLLGVRGDVQGTLLLELTEGALESLAAMAPQELKELGPDPDELARALLEETANLLFSTYLDVFSDVCGMRLLPTPPEFVQAPSNVLDAWFRSAQESRAEAAGARLLSSGLMLKSPETRIRVCALFSGEVVDRLLEGAHHHLPELF